MTTDYITGSATLVVPGHLVASLDKLAVMLILEQGFTKALVEVSDALQVAMAETPHLAVGFNHLHVTLSVSGEVLREEED